MKKIERQVSAKERSRDESPCPVCHRAPVLTAVSTGEQACSDLNCQAAHGYSNAPTETP